MIIFERIALDPSSLKLAAALEVASNRPLPRVTFFQGGMELVKDADAMVDFANKQLHIGIIIPSATQEELLFSAFPECFAGLVICETMGDREAIQIKGVRQYCETAGFLRTFKVTGPSADTRPTSIIAIDAAVVKTTKKISSQCARPLLDRDIVKAVIGFSGMKTVATGHWGCGVFGGDIYCKFLMQLLAASICDVSLVYCLVGTKAKAEESDLKAIYEALIKNNWTAAAVYRAMSEYKGPENSADLYRFLLEKFGLLRIAYS
jgi:poly(ADP-ribose) glycohydrolase